MAQSKVSGPFTPQKKDDPINSFVRSLNAKWNLELPIKDGQYSPSKRTDPASKEEQLFGLIKYLHYKNSIALQNAVAAFEHEALDLEASERDQQHTIQHLNKNDIGFYFPKRKDSFIKRKRFVDTSALADLLLRILSAAKASCLQRGGPAQPNLPVHAPLPEATTNVEHASPFECSIDDTTLVLLAGEDKKASSLEEDFEDIWTTPPSSPTHSPLPSPLFADEDGDSVFKKPELCAGQKRPLPEPTKRVSAPKVSRGRESHVSPSQSVSEARPESPLARSFASTASSSFVSSQESNPKKIDTAATSFSSNVGTSTQANKQLQREAADANLYTTSKTSFNSHSFSHLPEPLPDLLLRESPFTRERSPMHCKGSFRQSYEIARVALHCKIPANDIPTELNIPTSDYSSLWSSLKGIGTLPERSKLLAWRKAETSWTGVSLSGELTFNWGRDGPVFDFQLSPMKIEKSYRFSREFGGDRFLTINLPSLRGRDLPENLRRKKHHEAVRKDILDWLVSTGHHILGRTWRAFFVKPLERPKGQKMHRTEVTPGAHRVYLFATDGPDFVSKHESHSNKSNHRVVSVQELLEWFMPAKPNLDLLALKFFARLSLGVSTTIPTIEFSPLQVIFSDDAFSDSPQERRLNVKRSDDKIRGKKLSNSSNVMNDGCALISQEAARGIARRMDLLDGVPSVFQGRIGGAKGIWMVDPLGQRWNKSSNPSNIWIEITDSQLKFQDHRWNDFQLERNRVTFEVLSWCRPLVSSCLNFQMMPILIHGGVPPSVLETMLEEDLRSKAAEMEAAMEHPLKLRFWIQENHNPSGERLDKGTIEWQGGMPDTKAERVVWFVEHGFDPKTCKPLKDLCFTLVRDYCLRLEERMNVSIGLSTYAYIIADPLAILEEGEIHFSFSNHFNDPKSGFSNDALENMDVLVARSPSHLPSDIQKVRAVYHRALARYKDVVIFPSKGKRALADKLSGGDYDGDKVWICWEPQIVKPFRNSEVHDGPEPEYFGIQKDSTKVMDIFEGDDDEFKAEYASKLIRKGFECNIAAPILGLCTNWFDGYCYLGENSIDDPMAKNIAKLLGYLVDSAKAGHTYTEQMWSDFKKEHELPRNPGKPAYKVKKGVKPTNHIIDRLVFDVAQTVIADVMKNFEMRFGEKAILRDDDLTAPWKAEDALAKKFPEVKELLKYISSKLEKIRKFWGENVASGQEDSGGFGAPKRVPTRAGARQRMPFTALVQTCRDRFLAIEPPVALKSTNAPSYILDRWTSDIDGWNRLKASGAFYRFQGKPFTWNTCGMELGKIKLATTKNGGRGVEEGIHLAMKVDRKFRAVLDVEDEDGSGLRSQFGGDLDDEYGLGDEDWGLDD